MSRPLRLTAEEALALVVALRTLAETPGIADSDAVAAGAREGRGRRRGRRRPAGTVTVALDRVDRLLPVLQRAVDEQRALALRYYTATRDETTERDRRPAARVRKADGRAYLEAWCRRAEGMRVFRVDRIEDVRLLDEPARPPAEAQLRDLAEGRVPASVRAPAGRAAGRPGLRVGGRLLPGRGGHRGRDGTGRSACGSRTRPGSGRSCSGPAGQVEVLSPEWLAESVASEAAAALAAYATF